MLRLLFDCLLWGLGFERRSAATSSGFDGDDLVAIRRRTLPEAAVRLLGSLLFIPTAGINLSLLVPLGVPRDGLINEWLTGGDFPLITGSSIAWCILMLARPSLPMDRPAIATGLWSLAAYLPFFLVGNLTAVPFEAMLWQCTAVGAVLAYGLFRDIRREMHADNGRR
jgi:hypothetical protein